MKRIEYTVGSGNVFDDLSIPNARVALVKAQLGLQISRILKTQRLTQADAAGRMGVSQAKVSSLVRGELRGISEAKLQACLNMLGHDVQIVVKPHVGQGKGTTSVVFKPTTRVKKSRSKSNHRNDKAPAHA